MTTTKKSQEYLTNVEKQRQKLLKSGKGGKEEAAAFVEGQRREGKKLAGQQDGNKFQRIAQNRLRGPLYDIPKNSAKKQPKLEGPLYDYPAKKQPKLEGPLYDYPKSPARKFAGKKVTGRAPVTHTVTRNRRGYMPKVVKVRDPAPILGRKDGK